MSGKVELAPAKGELRDPPGTQEAPARSSQTYSRVSRRKTATPDLHTNILLPHGKQLKSRDTRRHRPTPQRPYASWLLMQSQQRSGAGFPALGGTRLCGSRFLKPVRGEGGMRKAPCTRQPLPIHRRF